MNANFIFIYFYFYFFFIKLKYFILFYYKKFLLVCVGLAEINYYFKCFSMRERNLVFGLKTELALVNYSILSLFSLNPQS